MPGNCGAFDSTFERQGEFIHLPVRDLSRLLARFLPQKWPHSAGHLLGFTSRKIKIPAIYPARRRHGYKLLVHNTSQCEYYKGGCLEVEESQCMSGPCNPEIFCEPPETVTVNYS